MQQKLTQYVNDKKNEDGGPGRAYPFLQRGVEVEYESQKEIDSLKLYLASLGIHMPIQTLRRAIFMPRDEENIDRKYPKIGDYLQESI